MPLGKITRFADRWPGREENWKRFSRKEPNVSSPWPATLRSRIGTINALRLPAIALPQPVRKLLSAPANPLFLFGVSRDSAGAILANCTVMIFRTEDKSFIGQTVSDGVGAWSYSITVGGPFFLVEYLVGTPDRAGTSVNTLVGV
jgi:hypothetical protein